MYIVLLREYGIFCECYGDHRYLHVLPPPFPPRRSADLQTASVGPSSRYLARLMVEHIVPDDGRVIELGGGTGVFTRAILGTGLPPEKLEVVEINPAFARGLRRHFPHVSVLETPAQIVSTATAGEAGEYQRSEEHTSELQSLMRSSYAVFCLKKK